MATKSPTPQAISRLLAKAGFERSQPRPGVLSAPTEGYVVKSQLFGVVSVEYKTGYDRGVNAVKRRDEMLDKYSSAIRAGGWTVEVGERAIFPTLIVTAPDSDSGGEG